MARMIPHRLGNKETLMKDSLFKDSPGKDGETEFYRIARDLLPDDWTVIYNQVTINKAGDHQIDFLVCIPEKGIVNVDAKGHKYSWRNGTFCLNNTPKDLFNIASGAIHTFDNEVRDRLKLGQTPWGAYGRCLMFMLDDFSGIEDCQTQLKDPKRKFRGLDDKDRIPGGFPYMTRSDFCKNDKILVENIKSKLIGELDKFPNVQRYFSQYMDGIIAHYEKHLFPIKRTEVFTQNNELLEQRFIQFTEEQSDLIDILFSEGQKFIHIPGVAGSGKTLLAMLAMNHFLSLKKRVLYVCFNENLAKKVSFETEAEHRKNLIVSHIDGLPRKIGRGLERGSAEQRRQFFLKSLTDNAPERFDVVVVDEGQDFDAACFRIISKFLSPGFLKFIVFSDDEQSINNPTGNWQFPDEFAKVFANAHQNKLMYNLRNARKIFEKDQKIFPNNSQSKQVENGNEYPTSKTLLEEIIALKDAKGYRPRNIAVLAFSQDVLDQAQTSWGTSLRIGEDYSEWMSEENDWNWSKKPYIWGGCVQGFKGLEADCLILLGQIPKDILGHTAVTRAKLVLIQKNNV